MSNGALQFSASGVVSGFSAVPSGLAGDSDGSPGLESLGYCRKSLRDCATRYPKPARGIRRNGLAALLMLVLCFSGTAAEKTPVGDWSGTLQTGGVKLRLLFKIRKTSEASLSATLDSLDQGAKDIPVENIIFKEDKLHLEVKLIRGIYEGTLDTAGNKISGTWAQGAESTPLNLVRGIVPPDAEPLSPADAAASKVAAEKLAGAWSAILKAGADQFRLALTIKTNRDGTAGGTLDSLDQGLTQIPISRITYQDGKVHFEARGMGAHYDGASFNNSTSVTGQWHQAGQTLPLNFTKSGAK
jgi:hypothetical protein